MSINEAADKAAAGALLHGAQQQASAYAPGYAPPPQGVKAEQVIDYLLVHYGHAIEQNDHMRGRVWQLEAVNDNHLRSRQELCDMVVELRQQLSKREDELAAAKAATIAADMVANAAISERDNLRVDCQRYREQAACVQPKVMASYWGRGGRTLERELPLLSVQSGAGVERIRISVDLRNHSRKRAG